MFDGLARLPIWQRLLLFVFICAVIVGGWYYFFYLDEVTSREAADTALVTAEKELETVRTKRDNFDAEKRKVEEAEKALEAQREVLPLTASTVDNLMQTFQQQSRLVGMTVESWNNEPEEFEDFYARMPIRVKASGTWTQVGEFFRRVSELKRIVSVDRLGLTVVASAARDGEKPDEHPGLRVEFEAATYRFLTDTEREAAAAGPAAKKGRRRK